VKRVLRDAHIPVLANTAHIVPVMVGSAENARLASEMLLAKHKIYVQAINYPTVPVGSERLRVTPGPSHDEAAILHLRDALVDVWEELDLPRSGFGEEVLLDSHVRGDVGVKPLLDRPLMM